MADGQRPWHTIPIRGRNPELLRLREPCVTCGCVRDFHTNLTNTCNAEGCECRRYAATRAEEVENERRLAIEDSYRQRAREPVQGRRVRVPENRPGEAEHRARVVLDEGYLEAWRRQATGDGELETTAPSLHIRQEGELRCPYCHETDFDKDPAVRCAACKAWTHLECLRDNNDRCPACSKRRET